MSTMNIVLFAIAAVFGVLYVMRRRARLQRRRLSDSSCIIWRFDVMTSKRLIALFLGASLAGGCATGNRGSLTGDLDKPGKPALDLGGPAPSGSFRSRST